MEVVRYHLDTVRGDEQCDDDDEVSGSQQERGVQAGQVHDAADDNTRGGGTCEFVKNLRCQTHNCDLKSVLVTSKRWAWKEKLKCYGNVVSGRKKMICPLRNSGLVAPTIVPTMCTAVQRGGEGSVQTGRQSSVETRGGANQKGKVG